MQPFTAPPSCVLLWTLPSSGPWEFLLLDPRAFALAHPLVVWNVLSFLSSTACRPSTKSSFANSPVSFRSLSGHFPGPPPSLDPCVLPVSTCLHVFTLSAPGAELIQYPTVPLCLPHRRHSACVWWTLAPSFYHLDNHWMKELCPSLLCLLKDANPQNPKWLILNSANL